MGHALTKSKSKKEEVLKLESEDYFIRNGGILLEKQLALCHGQEKAGVQLKILSNKDIEKATNSYDPDLIIANTRRTIYKGTLDNQVVVVKALREDKGDPKRFDLFLTEAATGMVMNHANITNLYGCCLETDVPIPVYEFLPNGVLFHQLHGNTISCTPLKWCYRLRIAADVAYGLSYMHNGFSKPVVHRDIKSRSVILDNSFHAKLTNLGYSVSITPGDISQRWPVQGTLGYVDPEYIETNEVTEKCDVYSYGVLMLELLTGRNPKMLAKSRTDLVDVFVSAVDRDCAMELIDPVVLEQGSMDEIKRIMHLTLTCVAKKGVKRPTMIEVVKEIWLIQGRGWILKEVPLVDRSNSNEEIENKGGEQKLESTKIYFTTNGGSVYKEQIALSQGEYIIGAAQMKILPKGKTTVLQTTTILMSLLVIIMGVPSGRAYHHVGGDEGPMLYLIRRMSCRS